MARSRTWLAIPALALACAGVAAAAGAHPPALIAVGALGAALAAAVRAFAGGSLPAALAGAAAALLGAVTVVALADGTAVAGPLSLARVALAGAAAMFAIAEIARPTPLAVTPLPAIGAAVLAGVLDPSYVALVPVAGARLAFGPWDRPRWTILVPLAGVLATVVAVLAACASRGVFAELWRAWVGHSAAAAPVLDVAARAGDALGPLAIVAAVVGLATCIAASRFAAAAVLAVTLAAAAVAIRTGGFAPSLAIASSLACGVAVARLAALVRHPVGQACAGAVATLVLLVAPALALL